MSEATLIELKAKAYDVLSKIEQLQAILRSINNDILELSKQPAVVEPKEATPA